ncbi:MAG: FAD:protein FMN transferase, partial [Krumholzibacteria bacterium]|nr:FAD:protein FMN transferase [Candidatus Krumholzibacteria bacterium]
MCLSTLLAVFLAACDSGQRRTDFAFATLGTIARCDLALPAGLDEAGARRLVAAVCDSVNAVLSSWDPASELARLNAAPAGARVPVSPWLAACLGAAGRPWFGRIAEKYNYSNQYTTIDLAQPGHWRHGQRDTACPNRHYERSEWSQ